MSRKKGFWLVLLILVLAVAGGGYYYYTALYLPAQEPAEPTMQTAKVRQGNIVVSASGAGTVVPATEIGLGFRSSGTLVEVLVQVGDQVQAGDVLARLDDTDARKAVALAELQVQQAALQADVTALTGDLSAPMSQAEMNLRLAQAKLDELVAWQPDETAVSLAQANLTAAQANLDAAENKDAAAGSSATAARVNYELAQSALVTAQSAYDVAYDPGRDWELNDTRRATALLNEREAATRNLEKAQGALEIAQANYYLAAASINDNNAVSAQVSLLNAEQALQNAQIGPSETDIEAAQTAVQQAELNLAQGRLSLTQAQINLEAAQAALAATELVAPVDGVVLAVNGQTGESVSTAPFVTLADLAQPLLEMYVEETSLDKVAMGYEVDVVFDAFPDDVFVGHVAQVDPRLSVVDGVTAVRGLVTLDEFAKPQTLPIGLNAAIEVIGGRAEGALIVPVESLRELSPGQYAVFVLEDGEPTLRMVQVGLMDFTSAEIVSGLEKGEVISTGVVETE